jgi:hypothetical protein
MVRYLFISSSDTTGSSDYMYYTPGRTMGREENRQDGL